MVITSARSGWARRPPGYSPPRGATVVLGARRADRIQSLADELTSDGGMAIAITTDVTRSDQVKRLVDSYSALRVGPICL